MNKNTFDWSLFAAPDPKVLAEFTRKVQAIIYEYNTTEPLEIYSQIPKDDLAELLDRLRASTDYDERKQLRTLIVQIVRNAHVASRDVTSDNRRRLDRIRSSGTRQPSRDPSGRPRNRSRYHKPQRRLYSVR